MKELITSLVIQFGFDKNKAENGLGALLITVKKNAPSEVFQNLSSAIPAAESLISVFANQKKSNSSDILESISKMAESLLVGQTKQLSSLIDNFAKAGFSLDSVKQFLPVVFNYLQFKMSADAMTKIYSSIPGLDGLLGIPKSGGMLDNLSKLFYLANGQTDANK